MEIVPAQLQLHVELAVNTLMPWLVAMDEPGLHGAVVTGMQGIFVKTP